MDRRTFIKRSGAIVAISGAIDAAAKPPQQSSPEAPVDIGELSKTENFSSRMKVPFPRASLPASAAR